MPKGVAFAANTKSCGSDPFTVLIANVVAAPHGDRQLVDRFSPAAASQPTSSGDRQW